MEAWTTDYALGQKLCNVQSTLKKHGFWNAHTVVPHGTVDGYWYGYKAIFDLLNYEYPEDVDPRVVLHHNLSDEELSGEVPINNGAL